jgi:hypothetical protein
VDLAKNNVNKSDTLPLLGRERGIYRNMLSDL